MRAGMSAPAITDAERLDFIAEAARMSRTSVFFDYDGATGSYRFFISPDYISKSKTSIRDLIDCAIRERDRRKK